VEVEREVAGEPLLPKDVAKQIFVARTHEDLVVRDVLVAAIGAEIDHEERHRVPKPTHTAIGVHAAHTSRHELQVGVCEVGVAHHSVCR
jgi:hypothetical protein